MKKLSDSGSVLIAIVVLMPLFILITASYMQLALTNYYVARKDQYRTHAQFAADAGVDTAMESINTIADWPGTGSEQPLHDDGKLCTTYQSVVNTIDDDNKTVTATGKTYRSGTCSGTPLSSVTINVNLRPVRSGEFSVVGGVGGLYLENHAKILGGDVHVNGRVELKNHAQIGQTTQLVNLTVANQTCPQPPDSTYPELCSLGDNNNPISIIDDAHIYGNVRANHQTNNYPSAMTDAGLTASSGVAVEELPEHIRSTQIGAVTTTRSGTDASCATNNGTKTWEANTKITGDVEISGNTDKPCVVTIKGDVWITGKLIMERGGKLVVSDSVGATKPNIMVDNKITELKNKATITANSQGTGVQIISYWSNNSCTYAVVSPCISLDGTDLFNSRNEVTIKLDNDGSAGKTIFYAKFTKVLVANSGDIGALVGQTVHLQNSGSVSFGSSVGGATEFWVIDSYQKGF